MLLFLPEVRQHGQLPPQKGRLCRLQETVKGSIVKKFFAVGTFFLASVFLSAAIPLSAAEEPDTQLVQHYKGAIAVEFFRCRSSLQLARLRAEEASPR